MGLTVLLALAGCGDPCRELSDRICRCQPDPVLRRQCEQKVGIRASQLGGSASPGDDSRCQLWLGSCDCEALQAGNISACGLTPDAAP